MDKKLIAGSALAGLVLAGGVFGAVSAQSVANATGLTEEQVIAIALEEVPGDVQEVELEREDGMRIYEVSIRAEDGSEVEVEIAADTGDVLQTEIDKDGCDKDQDA